MTQTYFKILNNKFSIEISLQVPLEIRVQGLVWDCDWFVGP